jgi:hypothetical protein
VGEIGLEQGALCIRQRLKRRAQLAQNGRQ